MVIADIADEGAYAGRILRRYVPGASIDERVAMITTDPSTCSSLNGAATYSGAVCATMDREFYHADRQGNVIAMAAQSGAMTAQYVYTPYGVEEPYNSSTNPYRYTGRRLESEWVIFHYRARYYDPAMGRFYQTDPVLYADQFNLYAYVGNDPLNRTDPTGESWRLVSAGGKFLYRGVRYRGNFVRAGRETGRELMRDAGAVVSAGSTMQQRGEGLFNLASPITTRDMAAIGDWTEGILLNEAEGAEDGYNEEAQGWRPDDVSVEIDTEIKSAAPSSENGPVATENEDGSISTNLNDDDGESGLGEVADERDEGRLRDGGAAQAVGEILDAIPDIFPDVPGGGR